VEPEGLGKLNKINLPHRVLLFFAMLESESLYGSQSVSMSCVEPTLWTLDHILVPVHYLGLKFVVLSLWGALSDERPGLSFVSRSLFS
jgi:hypothetical protein